MSHCDKSVTFVLYKHNWLNLDLLNELDLAHKQQTMDLALKSQNQDIALYQALDLTL